MNDASLEKSQGIIPDAIFDSELDGDIKKLLKYANLAQAMAHDCAALLCVLQNAIDYDHGEDSALLSGYGQGALQRLVANSMSLMASEGERVLCDFRSDDRA